MKQVDETTSHLKVINMARYKLLERDKLVCLIVIKKWHSFWGFNTYPLQLGHEQFLLLVPDVNVGAGDGVIILW